MRREFSAGGLVYKKSGGGVLWLVRRPTAGQNYRGNLGWSFPKGWIDAGETTEAAAIREVREEGGVEAVIKAKLPTLKIFFTDPKGEKVMKFITYFVMEYTADVPEGHDQETEEVKWVSRSGGEEILAFKSEKGLLKLAEQTGDQA